MHRSHIPPLGACTIARKAVVKCIPFYAITRLALFCGIEPTYGWTVGTIVLAPVPLLTMSRQLHGSLPTISLGMPVYNSEKWLPAAIESLLAQTFADFELIISDNASTDATYALCERYARQDKRIRLVRNVENLGANRNYLLVLGAAQGRYFKWASSNDICGRAFLERCIAALEVDRSAVLACPRSSLFEVDIDSAVPYRDDFELVSADPIERFCGLLDRIRLNNNFNGLIRTAALREAAPMGNFQGADIVLMAELALLGKFILLSDRLFFRRMSEDSATKLKTAQQVDQHLAPRATRPLRWQHWRYFGALFAAAWRRGPLTSLSMRLMIIVLRRMRWGRSALLQDMRQALWRQHW